MALHIQGKYFYRLVPDAATEAEIGAAIMAIETEANAWFANQDPARFHWHNVVFGRALKHLGIMVAVDIVKEKP